MLKALETKLKDKAEGALYLFELIFWMSGTSIAFLYGKFLLAFVLAAFAIGVVFRFTRRTKRQPAQS
jgi:multisubunit Na+/H+ antiporter MnhE subunit